LSVRKEAAMDPKKTSHRQQRQTEEPRQAKSTQGSESSELKQREYRDSKGNIHHHTRTARGHQGKH
jgi:hypothetical protein